MPQPQPLLKIDAAQHHDAYVIRIEGELDVARCPDLEVALADAERSRAGRIVVDLDGLNSIDARGLQTLLRAARRSSGNGNRLRLTRGRGDVAHMFRLMMLDVTLPFTSVSPQASGRRNERMRPRVSALGESVSAQLLRLQEEARLARRRFQLYKARTYGPRFTDPVHLFELERGFLMAENRLRRTNPAAVDGGGERAPE